MTDAAQANQQQINHHRLAGKKHEEAPQESKPATDRPADQHPDQAPKPFLTVLDVSKIHWKAQALTHMLYGIWMGLLFVYSWGISLKGMIQVMAIYLALYIFVYIPIFLFIPRFSLDKVLPILRILNKNEGISTDEQTTLIEFLARMPRHLAKVTAIVTPTAYVLGAIIWASGLVPELLPIINLTLIQTFFLGFIITVCEALMVYALTSIQSTDLIERLMRRYPSLTYQKFNVPHTSWYAKIQLLIILIALTGQTAVSIFFVAYLSVTDTATFVQNLVLVSLIILLSLIYIITLVPIITRNITLPMEKLIAWTKSITAGNKSERLSFVTDDEINDMISSSNQMITELNMANEQLKNALADLEKERAQVVTQSNQLSAILTGVSDGVIALDENFNVTLLNDSGAAILQTPEYKLLGKNIDAYITLTDPQKKPLKLSSFISVHQKNTNASEVVYALNADSQNPTYINLDYNKVINTSDGSTTHIITFHDVTRIKRLEEMRLDFVSMAAHELRTPLTSILGYLSVFQKEAGPKFTKTNQMFIDRISTSAAQLRALIENLLNVSKIERQSLEISPAPIDLLKIGRNVVEEFAIPAQDKDVELQLDEPEKDLTHVSGDALRIREVLSNLVANAINYTLPKGAVTIHYEEDDYYVVTHVTDTGVGIPNEALDQLFTKFFRVSSDLNKGSKGTGLGLFISKSIIDLHNGKIWVESKEGKGSTFSFALPKKQNG
ncbi:hypothetical protein KC614_04710 [candidate division WWE3 bacterium]|uniref:histidine kinase n=1 Tax=candidate division WWE3 bacterium TaxID=2053526 RepID=A0A955LL24_UNCKA|nr:hypothetical protein [candidate division WWE3 bacterium]